MVKMGRKFPLFEGKLIFETFKVLYICSARAPECFLPLQDLHESALRYILQWCAKHVFLLQAEIA